MKVKYLVAFLPIFLGNAFGSTADDFLSDKKNLQDPKKTSINTQIKAQEDDQIIDHETQIIIDKISETYEKREAAFNLLFKEKLNSDDLKHGATLLVEALDLESKHREYIYEPQAHMFVHSLDPSILSSFNRGEEDKKIIEALVQKIKETYK